MDYKRNFNEMVESLDNINEKYNKAIDRATAVKHLFHPEIQAKLLEQNHKCHLMIGKVQRALQMSQLAIDLNVMDKETMANLKAKAVDPMISMIEKNTQLFEEAVSSVQN